MSIEQTRTSISVAISVAAVLLGLALFTASARAAFGIAGFDGEVTANEAGDAYTQAGGHPFTASTEFALNQTTDSEGRAIPEQPMRNVQVALPPGFVANPLATPSRCTEFQLTTAKNPTEISIRGLCPQSAQVGTVNVNIGGEFHLLPLFNMVPGPDEPAELAARFLTTDFHIHTRVGVHDGEYRVFAELKDASNGLPVIANVVTLWGVPADPSHDGLRGSCLEFLGPTGASCPSEAPQTPLVTLPTACTPAGVGLETDLNIESWQGSAASAVFFSHLPGEPSQQIGPSGCSSVPFRPSLSLQPTSNSADSPTGLHVDLAVPQAGLDTEGGIASAHLRKAVVRPPKGMSVNPASANGLGACSLAQIGLGSDASPSCPDSSKIGTLEIETPLLDRPIGGSVYLAAQRDNPFGSLLAVYIVARGPGVLVKLPGHVEVMPDGQLVTTFDNNPQVPFSAMHLDFFAGPRAALRTPSACGTYTTYAELVPWSGNPPLHLQSSFAIDSGPNGAACPGGGFAPKLNAGTEQPLAGALSPLILRLNREDGEQELSELALTLPKGLLGRLAGVPYCPEAALASISPAEGTGLSQIAAPACPVASQIGTVGAGAGAGPAPLFVGTGRAYLAGPYKGAPLSIAIVTPAVAGPLDLGNVVLRAALHIDPATARVTAVSDPIPTNLHGIPLDLRDLRVDIDRPNFTLNPTSCAPMTVDALITSDHGATANPSSRFQAADCASLPFKPRLSLALKGPTRRASNPRLIANLTARPHEANIARAQVKLPNAAFLDNAHIKTICTRVQFAADACPPGSIYGKATATTPLLDYAVHGPVYLRSSDHLLPDLVVKLRGPETQPIEVDLVGRTDSVKGALRNSFEAVPDVPVSRFHLELFGGRRGLVELSRNLCRGTYRATVKLDAQNGKVHDTDPVVKTSCKSKKPD